MDKDQFPTLAEANDISPPKQEKADSLGSSWAEVNHTQENGINTSYADITKHSTEFPLPQETTDSEPTSSGVSDLLPKHTEHTPVDTAQPPNPERSFADVASNKGFPEPQADATEKPDNSLSSIPDVKEMLQQPSVHVPPPPASMSFAKVAATEIPPEKRPLSDRAKDIIKNQPKEEPLAMTNDNFPPLSQSNLMQEQNASNDERAVYSEISTLNEVMADESVKDKPKKEMSFADVTGSHLEDAPPSAVSHVDQHPVYDEDTVLLSKLKREEHKEMQQTHEEELKTKQEVYRGKGPIEAEDISTERQKEKEKIVKEAKENGVKERGMNGVKERGVNVNVNKNQSIMDQLKIFDKEGKGRITIFDTIIALYNLNYSWLTILPATFFIHLQLSPLTSPHRFPFIYHSLFDLMLLPIYTRNLGSALFLKTPLVTQKEDKVDELINMYGHKQGNVKGLGYWEGVKALGHLEKKTLKWWQLASWTIHRINWTLAYTMLHESKTDLVTTSALVNLNKKISH
ncbi:hypothetical protein BDB01DRAFT_794922 [Pilobolus umbonatus]|nr:hypothetical protein BDB01DRAFT_794922 [Pilobolus umbonatus]